MEDLIKAKDLARFMNVSVETVRRWTRGGEIPVISIGGSKRYRLKDVVNALRDDHEKS